MHPGTICFNFCFCRCDKERNQLIHQLQTIQEERKAIEVQLEATKDCNDKLQELIGLKKVKTALLLYGTTCNIYPRS